VDFGLHQTNMTRSQFVQGGKVELPQSHSQVRTAARRVCLPRSFAIVDEHPIHIIIVFHVKCEVYCYKTTSEHILLS